MDSIFRLTQRVLQFVQGSASSSSSETGKEINNILDDLQSVRRTSAWIKAVLADAEERAVRGEELVNQWLIDLHHLNYSAADLLGLYEYEVAAQQIRDEEASATAAAASQGKRKLDQVYNSSPLTDPCFRQQFALGIRKFREEFDEINKLKEALRFDEEDGGKSKHRGIDMLEHLPTGSEPVDDLFFGRENKLRELIGYLLTDGIEVENGPNCKRVPVIALVGMGGVGKTTLAQHAYNDPKVCEFYSKKGWVCVSDNFLVPRVTRLILEALNERSSDGEFNALQIRLKAMAKETKFLLVLDDVWNEDVAPWDTFYSSLRGGAKGSKIIITTRSKTVADTAQAMKCIDVSCLSDEDAWNFFQTVVFGDQSNQHELDHPALTEVGKKITERCKGLPLAIKVLGRYLRCQNKDVHIWDEVLESKLLQPHEVNQVFGPLILSYLHLPACLKPCFVLASVFPKDRLITKQQFIDLWIAHELVEDGNENTGIRYIQTLVARSFFEIRKDVYGRKEYIMIHDIIHDLALHLSRDKMLHKTDGDDQGDDLLISEEVQHAFISFRNVPAVQLKFGITDTCGLRTLLVEGNTESLIVDPNPLHVEGNTKKLIVDPNPVNLNSLRSLTLPDGEKFSHEFLKRLKNLRHLDLRIRSPIVVTQGELDSICTFYNLRILEIEFLTEDENGISLPVCICNLRQLIHLRINGIRDIPDSIGCLTKLYRLYLDGSKIEYLPDTITKLVNLKEMDLSRSRIRCLPKSIGNLKALRVLNLKSCKSLIELPASIGEFKALEVLDLVRCGLIKLPASIGERNALKVLNLGWCESLIKLPASIGELKALKVLNLGWCESLIKLPESIGELKALEVLKLDGCRSLIELPANIGELKALEVLDLEWCGSLIKLPASIGELQALDFLNLGWCKSLIKLPASIGELKALVVLKLGGCRSLEGLPVGIKKLTKLRRLEGFRVPPRELVADGDAAGIEGLRELVCIKDRLVIEGLENVATQEEANQSELNNKRHIRWLQLEWDYNTCKKEREAQDEQVFQGLWPHANLEKLFIRGWNGRRLAWWLGDTSFVNLKEMRMWNIPNCKSLTPIHQLPSLRYLYGSNMASLLYLTATSFLCSDSDIRNSCFPALERLVLEDCPSLIFLADSMPLLEVLEFLQCDSVRALPDSLPSLKNLRIVGCGSLNYVLFHNLPALQDLIVSCCSSFRFLESTVFPSSLKSLHISRCRQAVNWCCDHRQSKLAHLPNVHPCGGGIEFSR